MLHLTDKLMLKNPTHTSESFEEPQKHCMAYSASWVMVCNLAYHMEKFIHLTQIVIDYLSWNKLPKEVYEPHNYVTSVQDFMCCTLSVKQTVKPECVGPTTVRNVYTP